ncbi:trichothecene 3-O-acetyltransferase [Microdochium nivale]|nr:trichothecene 3-O-acetyltransferase [Microdochium nivale]
MARLVSRPGWNKAGARLRKAADGSGYEHHIPASFSDERPAINFTCEDFSDVAIQDHPLASRLPQPAAGGTPAVVCDPSDFKPLICGPGVPIYASDYLTADMPQFGLRVLPFKNATVVTLHWLHLSFDAIAVSDILKAWRLMLEGREDEIPEPLPVEHYPLAEFGTAPKERHLLADVHLKIGGVLGWVARNSWSIFMAPKECRMLCVPARFWKKLREETLAELRAKDRPDAWVSEGDIIVAWFSRIALASYDKDGASSSAPVNIQQAVELRGRLPGSFPAGRPFLGNAMSFMAELVPIHDVLTKPVSYVANKIRNALITQTTSEQCEAYGSLVREDPTNKAPPFFGETGMHLLMYTSWAKSKLYDTDLEAALEKDHRSGASGAKNGVALPRYIQTIQGPYDFPDGIFIVGKDTYENFWISGCRAKGLWETMERAIREEWSG